MKPVLKLPTDNNGYPYPALVPDMDFVFEIVPTNPASTATRICSPGELKVVRLAALGQDILIKFHVDDGTTLSTNLGNSTYLAVNSEEIFSFDGFTHISAIVLSPEAGTELNVVGMR